MRSREPLLYEQYIGQYLTDEEVRASRRATLTASDQPSFRKSIELFLFQLKSHLAIDPADIRALSGGHEGELSRGVGERHGGARQPPPQHLPGAAHPDSAAGGAGEGGGRAGGGGGRERR